MDQTSASSQAEPTSRTRELFRERVAAVFRERPNVWISARRFMAVGGAFAWRSRISDCRTQLGMDIEWKERRIKAPITECRGGRMRTRLRMIRKESYYRFHSPRRSSAVTLEASGQIRFFAETA